MADEIVRVDLTAFSKSARKHIGKDWPIVAVEAFSDIAEHGRDEARQHTRYKFDLKSNFITNGIRHYPASPVQKSRARAALQRFGDMNAAVFLRGSHDPTKSLDFMVDHEEGGTRRAQKKYIAVPTQTLRQKGHRTGRGRVRKRWKPAQLLKRYDESGSHFTGSTTVTPAVARQKKRRYPGNAFLIKGKGGKIFIARAYRRPKRGVRKNLEFLYMLVPSVDIEQRWNFVDSVHDDVAKSYPGILRKHAKKFPNYK